MKTKSQRLWPVPGLALLTALALIPADRAAGQSFTILRSFGFLTNITGIHPQCTLVQGADGTFYGTTCGGEGNVIGTVFKVQPDGSGFTVLKRITASPNGPTFVGAGPQAGVALSGSTLYGTTDSGGSLGYGTVFKLNTDGTGYAVLWNFGSPGDGANPPAGLTLSGSTVYGTTYGGGSSGDGTVFSINTDGTGYTVLYNFTGGTDGAYPQAGLTLSGSTLYGTTTSGGPSNLGTVFSINTDGTSYTVLYNFTGSPDGRSPEAVLIPSGSTLYGATVSGGSSNDGTVFSINTDGTGYTVLYSFTGAPDGANPQAGLMLSGSTLYGTTTSGGTSNGTVFKLNTDGTGYTVLYNFPASYYGPSPRAPLMLSGSTLYGTTYGGGSSDYGAVFKLNTDGTGYTVLKSFAYSTDGRNPQAGLTVSGGTLYGTSENGGSSGGGTVFRLNTDGTGYTVLHNFVGPTDGNAPLGGLALSGSMLYGTASEYGSSLQGTVFKLNTNGTGYTVLHGFGVYGDGMNPQQGLTLSGSTLFGTTDPHTDNGTVFKLNINGTGYSALRNLNYSDGAEPSSDLTLSGSTLYGTTFAAGGAGFGTVFKLNTDGTGYTVLHDFAGSADGTNPDGLMLSGNTLYGTTHGGGSANWGTVFKLNTDGTGYTVLWNFAGAPDGAYPYGGLTPSGSTLYGTTYYGGSSNYGTVFKLKTDGTGYTVLWNFTGAPDDGAGPVAGLTLSGTTLYGTTANGGIIDEGTVFSLNLAPLLNITSIPGAVVLSWVDPAFNLQSAQEAAGTYTTIFGATSPYTNGITGGRHFFRLVTP